MKNIHEELREMLFFLIEGIKQWEQDYSKLPDKLYKGHMLLMKHTAIANSTIPNNLYDLIKTISKSSQDWGIPQIERLFSPDAALIESVNGLTIEAEDFINAYHSLNEVNQSVMKKIFTICRTHGLDKEYRFIRTFLSNSEHAVIDSFTLIRSINSNVNNSELKELVFECYEELPTPINNYRKCPHCGWTLQYRNGNWRCNKENVCYSIESFEYISEFDYQKTEKVFRLTGGIQRYILLPGIQELSFAERLEKKGYHIETYPEIDLFDIRVSFKGLQIDLDMKDYSSAYVLSDFLNQLPTNQLEKYHSNTFIIIPAYRLNISPAFIDLVNSRLDKKVKDRIKVMSENQLIKKLKEFC